MKEHLRKKFLKLRKSFSLVDKKKAEQNIFAQLKEQKVFQDAKHILIYYPIQNEVDIFEEILTIKDKNFYLPVVYKEKMFVRRFENREKLIKGQYGAMIPNENYKEIESDLLNLILVPGVVFNKTKYRIGYGKGYYDHFLKDLPAWKLGLAYEFQIIEDFLIEEHDQPMDFIITEKRTF